MGGVPVPACVPRANHAHAEADFYLLSETGQKSPPDFAAIDVEKIAGDKARVVEWLKRSLGAVKQAHAGIKPADLRRKVTIEDREAPVDGVYLRSQIRRFAVGCNSRTPILSITTSRIARCTCLRPFISI
jgi:hypothetical protein